MRHLMKKLFSLFLVVAMVVAMIPATTVQAAAKKTITVSTQAQLTKALVTKGVAKIIVKTNKTKKFSIKKGTYSAKLEMNAPKASITNSGKWRDVTVVDAKNYTEKAKNNKIVVKDKKLTFTVAKGANVKSVTFAKKGSSNTLKIDGTVGSLKVSEPSSLKIVNNGTLKNATLDAKVSLTVAGSSSKKMNLTLSKGAEGSKVAVKNADAKIDLKNKTKKTIEVTLADGTKKSVASGEKVNTSDIGKDDDDKQEEGKADEENKDEEKKPAAGGGGGGAGGGGSSATPSLTLNTTAVSLNKWINDGSVTLVATKTNISEAVVWSSSAPEYASVDSNGKVTALSAGTTTITATAGNISKTCTVSVDDTLNSAKFKAAIEATPANGTVKLGCNITDTALIDVVWNKQGNLTIDLQNFTLSGGLKITESGQTKGYTIVLKDNGDEIIGATIKGDLTIDAAHAHVENNVCVEGTSKIVAVADSTYQVKDKETKILLTGSGKLDIKTNKDKAPKVFIDTDKKVTLAGSVTDVTVKKPAEITVAASTTVEKVEIESSATADGKSVAIKGAGTVAELNASAPVEVAVATTDLTASAAVTVAENASISNVNIESNAATISLASGANVESISVGSDSVTGVKIEGAGTIGLIDVTKAAEAVSVTVSEVAANNISAVVATSAQAQHANLKNNTTINNKVATASAIEVISGSALKTSYYLGEDIVVANTSLRVVYSDGSKSKEIPVTKKMLDLSSVDKNVAGSYPLKVVYAGITSVAFAIVTYAADTVASTRYEKNSIRKRTYTREETFDPAGAVVILTYESGKTEQITSGLAFLIDGNNAVAPLNTKGTYTVTVKYDDKVAGTQDIIVNPKYFVLTLDPNENDRAKVTIRTEELLTVREVITNNQIALQETLTPQAHEHRMWTFAGWKKVVNSSVESGTFSWDSQVTSDIDLVGTWNEVTPEKDVVTITVSGSAIAANAKYDVNRYDVDSFLRTVSGSSERCGSNVLVKYGLEGADVAQMSAFELGQSPLTPGKTYQFVYYTEDGTTFDGASASILVNIIDADKLVAASYIGGSMKREYNRTEQFDPTGTKILLVYASGRTDECTDTSKMRFTVGDNNDTIANDLFNTVGTYTIKVQYESFYAGAQEVVVVPNYYRVELNPDEGGRQIEVAPRVKEGTTLADLVSSRAITLTETLTPSAIQNRNWDFVGWKYADGSKPDVSFTWDTPINSNLNLVASWTKNGLTDDTVTLAVNGNPVKEDRTYRVQVDSVHDFLKTVSTTSANNGDVHVKYGIKDQAERTVLSGSEVFDPNKTYEFVYYTDDGKSYNGGSASIYVETKAGLLDFETNSKGYIILKKGIVQVAYKTVDYPSVNENNIVVTGGSIEAVPGAGGIINGPTHMFIDPANHVLNFRMEHLVNGRDEFKIDNQYGVKFSFGLSGSTMYHAETNVVFDSEIDGNTIMSRWITNEYAGHPEDYISLKYWGDMQTVGQQFVQNLPADVKMEYASGIDNGNASYTSISSLNDISLSGSKTFTIRLTRNGIPFKFYIDFYQGSMIMNTTVTNKNCIHIELADNPTKDDFNFSIQGLASSGGSIAISDVFGQGRFISIVLDADLVEGQQYVISIIDDGVTRSRTMTIPIFKNYDYAFSGVNVTSNNEVEISLNLRGGASASGTPRIDTMLVEQTSNGARFIPYDCLWTSNYDKLILKPNETITCNELHLIVYGDDLERVYQGNLQMNVTTLQRITSSNISDMVDSSGNITKPGNFLLETDYTAPNGLTVSTGTAIYIAPGYRFIVGAGNVINNYGIISNQNGSLLNNSASTLALRSTSQSAGCLDIAVGGSINAMPNSVLDFANKEDLMSRAENGLLLYPDTSLTIGGKQYIGSSGMVELESLDSSGRPAAGWYINGDGWLCLVVGDKATVTDHCADGEMDLHIIAKSAGFTGTQTAPAQLYMRSLEQLMPPVNGDITGESGGTLTIEQYASLYISGKPYVLPIEQESDGTITNSKANGAVMCFVTNSDKKAKMDNAGVGIPADSNRHATCFRRSGNNVLFFSDWGHLYINKIDALLKMGKVYCVTYANNDVKSHYDNNQASGGYNTVFDVDWLTINGVQLETIDGKNALRFQVADLSTGSSVRYALDVQKMGANGPEQSYSSSTESDISNGLVVFDVADELLQGGTTYIVRLICWRDDIKQQEFSKNHNLYTVDNKGNTEIRLECGNGGNSGSGSQEEVIDDLNLYINNVTVTSSGALEVSFEDKKNPNNDSGNTYEVMLRKVGTNADDVLASVIVTGSGIVTLNPDSATLSEIMQYTGKTPESPYYFSILNLNENQPSLSRFSAAYYMKIENGQVELFEHVVHPEWLTVTATEDTSVTTESAVNFTINDVRSNASGGSREYYFGIRRNDNGNDTMIYDASCIGGNSITITDSMLASYANSKVKMSDLCMEDGYYLFAICKESNNFEAVAHYSFGTKDNHLQLIPRK